MDVGVGRRKDAKAEGFAALRDFVRVRRTGEYGRLTKPRMSGKRTTGVVMKYQAKMECAAVANRTAGLSSIIR